MENDQNYFDTEVFEAKHMKKTILRFIRSMGKQKWRLTVVFICIAFYTYFTVMAPLYSADVVDLIWNQMKEAMQTRTAFSDHLGVWRKAAFLPSSHVFSLRYLLFPPKLSYGKLCRKIESAAAGGDQREVKPSSLVLL